MPQENETFEQRIEREKREAKIKRVRIAGIISGLGFTPEADTGEEGSMARVRGIRPDGARCVMEQDTYQLDGRIAFSAWTPSPEDGTSVKTPAQVTFTAQKDDQAIIKGIKSRYMPAFEPCMVEYKTRYDRARKAEEAQDALINGCAQLLGYPAQKRTRKGEKPHLYKYTESEHVKKILIDTNYHGTEARLELALSPEAAMLICSKLGEWLKKGGA